MDRAAVEKEAVAAMMACALDLTCGSGSTAMRDHGPGSCECPRWNPGRTRWSQVFVDGSEGLSACRLRCSGPHDGLAGEFPVWQPGMEAPYAYGGIPYVASRRSRPLRGRPKGAAKSRSDLAKVGIPSEVALQLSLSIEPKLINNQH